MLGDLTSESLHEGLRVHRDAGQLVDAHGKLKFVNYQPQTRNKRGG